MVVVHNAPLAIVTCLGLVLGVVGQGAIPHAHHFPAHRQRTIQRVLGSAYSASCEADPSSSRVFRPTDYGADPLGVADSSDAIDKAIQAMTASAAPGEDGFVSLGGAILDLAGGNYSVSRSVVFPASFSNFNIQSGSLTAGDDFPVGATLLQVGSNEVGKGQAEQNVNLMRLTLDGRSRAGTVLSVVNGQYANVGPGVMVYRWRDFGITINGTGGCYIHHSWLGEIAPFDHVTSRDSVKGTAISLNGMEHDAYVEDVIIWSGRVGVNSTNGANQMQGVHAWNLQTGMGGAGIILYRKGKIIDCYLDFCPLILKNPNSIVVSNNLFLAKANLVILRDENHPWMSDNVTDLVVTNNRWDSEDKYQNDTIIVEGDFKSVMDTVIENNAADSMWSVKGTRSTRTVDIPQNSTLVSIDYSDDLVFPGLPIQEVSCTVRAREAVAHSVRMVDEDYPHSIAVALSAPVSKGKLSCTVDQSLRSHGAH